MKIMIFKNKYLKLKTKEAYWVYAFKQNGIMEMITLDEPLDNASVRKVAFSDEEKFIQVIKEIKINAEFITAGEFNSYKKKAKDFIRSIEKEEEVEA